jgi:hypothetical protein
MCHDFATKLLSVFIKIEKCFKTKKPANPWICRFLHVFGFFEKIDKVAFFTSFPLFVGRAGFELYA